MSASRSFLASLAAATALGLLASKPSLPEEGGVSLPDGGLKVLFNGEDLAGWRARSQEKPNRWIAQDGALVSAGPGTDLLTEETFGNFEFHCEYKIPARGRGGVYLRGRYEIRIADEPGGAPGFQSNGAVVNLICPSQNAGLKADQWQTMDVTLSGKTVTLILNGKKVIPEILMPHPTWGALNANEDQPGPIMLRGNLGRLSFRDLRIKPLPSAAATVQPTAAYGVRSPPITLLKLDDGARDLFEKSHPGLLPEVPIRARLPFPSQKAFNWCGLNQDFYLHNQGASGTCWANTAVEALECNWLIRNGIRHRFSPQPILDYTQRPNGANSGIAFDVLLKHGTALLSEYSFAGQPGKLRTNIHTRFRAVAWGRVGEKRTPPTTEEVKAALLEHGPLAVDLFATPALKKYTTGVFAEHYLPGKNEPRSNHEVLLLGWDDRRGKGAWYIKNSWGEKWGERGYCWIEYGCNNICHDVWWVKAQSTYYVLSKQAFLKLLPDADSPMVWNSPIAPQAEVKAVRMEHNVRRDDDKGMLFHVKAHLGRAKDRKALVAVYCLDDDAKFLSPKISHSAYAGHGGHLRVITHIVPPTDDSAFDDIPLFLPYSQIPLHEGRNRFRFQVYISCDGKELPLNHLFQGRFDVVHREP
jgi:hypothetical protein